MAGIGFKLQKILSEKTYSSVIKGYAFAAIISSGPWLFSVICVGLLGYLSGYFLEGHDKEIFRSMVVYTYAFSLIITGFFQMVVTRYISDRLFCEDEDAVLPTFGVVLLFTTALLGVCAGIFYCFIDFNIQLKVYSILLFIVVGNIWIVMVFLTALRNYNHIIWSFGIGVLFSMGLGFLLGHYYGLSGLTLGYLIGQFVILASLIAAVFSEFHFEKKMNREFLHYFGLYPQLIFISFFYNLGIWIDKFILWYSAEGTQIKDLFYSHPLYDTVVYLAYLTIIPSLSLFLIRIETSFYLSYRDFYGSIVNRRPYHEIQEQKKLLIDSINLSTYRLLIVQGSISLLFIVMSPFIIEILKLDWRQLHVLRIAILGSFLHALILVLSIIIQYFDLRNFSLGVSILFCFTNAIFTWISIKIGFSALGYGYFLGCLVTVIIGYIILIKKINCLEYLTFNNQPMFSNNAQASELLDP